MADQIEQKQILIKDLTGKSYYPFSSGGSFRNVIFFYIGRPGKGDTFQVVSRVTLLKADKIRMPGSDTGWVDGYRPNRDTATETVLETWRWSGRSFEQINE